MEPQTIYAAAAAAVYTAAGWNQLARVTGVIMNCSTWVLSQGIVGNIPWNALVFFTLYLQLLGMSDFHASLLMVRPPPFCISLGG